MPLTEVVHDRLNVEVFRGCTRGCRFCQAGMITRPVRERPADQVRDDWCSAGLEWSGHDEVALTSLSSADFSGHRGHGARRSSSDRRPTTGRVVGQTLHRRCASTRVHRGDGGRPRSRRCAARASRSRRRAARGACARVINKLITEDGQPLRRGRRGVQPGVAPRRKLLLPHRAADRGRDEDVLGIAEVFLAGARCVGDRAALPPKVGHGRGVGRRFRPQGAHAVPVVRHGHRSRAGAQGGVAARRGQAAKDPRARPSAGTTRPLRWPRVWRAGETGGWAP